MSEKAPAVHHSETSCFGQVNFGQKKRCLVAADGSKDAAMWNVRRRIDGNGVRVLSTTGSAWPVWRGAAGSLFEIYMRNVWKSV